MVGFGDLVGVDIDPLSKKLAVKSVALDAKESKIRVKLLIPIKTVTTIKLGKSNKLPC